MRTIIAGGRKYRFNADDVARLDVLKEELPITEVVSGGARGADRCGKAWAAGQGLPVRRFLADWDRHGRSAGPIRNGEMAAYAQALVAFPGDAGTADIVRKAEREGLRIYDWRS